MSEIMTSSNALRNKRQRRSQEGIARQHLSALELITQRACQECLSVGACQAANIAHCIVHDWLNALKRIANFPSKQPNGCIYCSQLDSDMLPHSADISEFLEKGTAAPWVSEAELRQVLNHVKQQESGIPNKLINYLNHSDYEVQWQPPDS